MCRLLVVSLGHIILAQIEPHFAKVTYMNDKIYLYCESSEKYFSISICKAYARLQLGEGLYEQPQLHGNLYINITPQVHQGCELT